MRFSVIDVTEKHLDDLKMHLLLSLASKSDFYFYFLNKCVFQSYPLGGMTGNRTQKSDNISVTEDG